MIDKIKSLLQEVEKIKAANAEELEALRIKYLSKKGEISMLMNDFRNVPAEQKREVGKFINELKETAQNKINELKENFENTQTINNDIDLTRSAYPLELGTRHPLSLVKKEICDIFGRLGFSIAEGPEIEDDWHVFTLPKIIRHATCRILSSFNIIQMYCFVHILHLYNQESWKNRNRLSVSFVRGVFIEMRQFLIVLTVSSTRLKRCM